MQILKTLSSEIFRCGTISMKQLYFFYYCTYLRPIYYWSKVLTNTLQLRTSFVSCSCCLESETTITALQGNTQHTFLPGCHKYSYLPKSSLRSKDNVQANQPPAICGVANVQSLRTFPQYLCFRVFHV